MKQIFYDHLVIREDIEIELDRYKIDLNDREEILRLADETLHHEVLNVILTKLPKEKHHQFLTHFHKNPADPKLLTDLKKDIADIEEEIKKVAARVKKEILSEVKKASA